MTAARPRERRRPPSPPDRRPPRRGGGSSPSPYTCASAAGRPAGPARLCGARRGLVRSARALAAAALLTLSGALALPAQAQTTCTVTPGDLWCGVLTIGTANLGGTTAHGYVGGAANTGSLSPNSFTREGTPFTVDKVTHNVPTVGISDLEFVTSPALPSGYNFVLQAGSQLYSFAGGETFNHFDPPGVDWSMSDGETVTLRLRETLSENATLSGLTVNDGSSDLALSPAFAPDTTSYTAWVPKAVEEVTLTATTLNPNATIAWLDGSGMTLADADAAAGHQVTLSEGENVIKMKVTAQDGTTMETYTVTVTRAAVGPPAAPTGLSATAGNSRVALAWTKPASDAVITRHEYRYKTDSDYQDNWKAIPYSAPGGFNEDGFTVTGLDNDTAHTFQLRAVNAGGGSGSVESSAVTPSGHGRIVESITMRRDDGQDGEPYGIGDKIVFVARFSQDVKCYDTGTTPRVVFDLGTGRKSANRTSGNVITRNVRYEYTVAEGDADTDGIGIPAGSTALPNPYYASGSCSDTFDKSGIKAQGPFPDRKVDGVYPSLDSAVVAGTLLNLFWDETLHDDSDPVEEDFAVTVAGSARSVTGFVYFDDSAVRLVLASAVRAGETVTVSYTKGTNPLKDLASNEAPALTDQAVKNNTVRTPPAEVTGFSAREGVVSVTLRWDAPASDADITHHEYRFKTTGSYPATWTPIPDSAPGGANEAGYRVEDLTAGTAHTFELRAVNDAGAGDADETKPVTPTAALPPNPHSTNFYLWSTTMTVGEDSDFFGYSKSDSLGELSTSAKFSYPPWSPPHKHHFDPDYRFAVDGLYFDPTGGTDHLILEIDDTGGSGISVGNLTLWIGNTSFPLGSLGGTSLTFGFDIPDVPDLDWEEDEEVRVVLSYKRRLPSAPQNVNVMAPRGEGGTLEVNWEEPEFGGTFPIECYLVEFRHPSGDAKKSKQSYPGSRGTGKGCGKEPPTSVKRTDLEPGVRYEVLVQALSGDGFGEWSDMKTAPRTKQGRALGARFVSPPERHDGEKRIKVRVEFSEAIEGTPETVGEHGVDVDGGRGDVGAPGGRRCAGRRGDRLEKPLDRQRATPDSRTGRWCGSSRSSRTRTAT